MPLNVMQLWVNDKRNANFPVKIAGRNATALYDTSANVSCMSYTCYTKLQDLPSLRNIHVLSLQSATGHDLSPMGLIHSGIILSNTQFVHTFIVCKNLQKELVIGLDM